MRLVGWAVLPEATGRSGALRKPVPSRDERTLVVTQGEATLESVLRVCRQHDDFRANSPQAPCRAVSAEQAPWLPPGGPCRARGFPLPDVLTQYTRSDFLRT